MIGLLDPQKHGYTWRDVAYRAKSAFAVLLSLAILVGGGWYVAVRAHKAWMDFREADDYIGTGEKDVQITIPPGTTVTQISDILVGADVIKTAKAFDRAAASNEKSNSLQAGRYKLKTHIPAQQALDMLLDPANQIRLKVTILEGWTLKQAYAQLAKPRDAGGTGFPLADFEKAGANPQALGLPAWAGKSLEGYLFPDTYNLIDAKNATEALKIIVARFNTVAAQISLTAGTDDDKMTPLQVMTIASIVEAETNRDADRGKAARVIYNRLDAGMRLQMDSTVHYATGKTGSVTTSDADRKNPSPYNTYVHKGLPPGPIGMPSKKSIQAAMNPPEGAWMYFVLMDLKTGETAFAETYAEHQANQAKFQENYRAYCQAHPELKCN